MTRQRYIKYLSLIYQYLSWRNEIRKKKGQQTSWCFTYEGIFSYIEKNKNIIDVKRTTVEREIRNMVQEGLLDRKEFKDTVIFCLNKNSFMLLKEYFSSITPEYENR